MIPFISTLSGGIKDATIAALVGAIFLGGPVVYVKGRLDGAAKERVKWEDAQRKKRLEQAADRRKAQMALDDLAEEHSQKEQEGRDQLREAQQELQNAEDDYASQSALMEEQLFELQGIISSLQEKDVDPQVIERIKKIRVTQPTDAIRARNERLRGALNSIR